MALTPDSAKQWLAVAATAIGLIGGAVGGTYQFALSTGKWGGKLEKANVILNDEHVGEKPVTETVVCAVPDDFQTVQNFDNGDALYLRVYKTVDGKKQKIKRWVSKRSLDDILGIADMRLGVVKSANADELAAALAAEADTWVGKRANGDSIYLVIETDGKTYCEFVNEGTGEITGSGEVPCEQYISK